MIPRLNHIANFATEPNDFDGRGNGRYRAWSGKKQRIPNVFRVALAVQASKPSPASAGPSLKRGRKIGTAAGYPPAMRRSHSL